MANYWAASGWYDKAILLRVTEGENKNNGQRITQSNESEVEVSQNNVKATSNRNEAHIIETFSQDGPTERHS